MTREDQAVRGATRWSIGFAAWAVAGCGTIVIVPLDGGGTEDTSTDSGDGQTADGDAVADVPSDGTVVSSDTVGGCTNDDQCKGQKGKTPCNFPVCETATGKCKLQLRAVGDTCVDPFQDVPECAETRCDAAGQCALQNAVDGQGCGVGGCGKVCKSGVCADATAADYDDKNPCTNDYCDQGTKVVHEPVTNLAMTCDDGNACTSADACIQGECQGATVACSDGIACTLDTCATAVGCQHTPQLGVCDDEDPCTKDACDLANGCTVVGFEVASCDDGNPCSEPDLCTGGVCQGQPSSASECQCTADSDCTAKSQDLCSGKFFCDTKFGVCAPKPNSAVVCDTSNDTACLVTTCNPKDAVCTQAAVPGGPACDDENPCTSASACQGGLCLATAQADCSDGKVCTKDECAADVGCFHVADTGACDDGDPCTGPDACQGGYCQGAKKSCDDGKLCTFDSCDQAGGLGDCTHVGDAAACNDNNPCTSDACDPVADCLNQPNDAASCDDGNVCTTDSCQSGKCVAVVVCDCAANADCDDKNPCTTDTCTSGKCVSANADGDKCSSPDKCQVALTGVCAEGVCKAGDVPVDCSAQANDCNLGVCDAATGKCQAVPKGAGSPCDDGDGCTEGDTCAGGTCKAGSPTDCQATPVGVCEVAACKSTGPTSHDCVAQPKGTGISCDDGLFCSMNDSCDGKGACVGSAYPCGSDGPCMAFNCDEAAKGCVPTYVDKGKPCEDGAFCTLDETCDGAGGCVNPKPRVCPGGQCLTGVCDESADTCTTTQTPDCCFGTNAAPCDDGQTCTSDACGGGACVHTSVSACCDPNVWTASFDGGQWQGVSITNSTGSPTQGWQLRQGAVNTSAPWAAYYGDVSKNSFDFGATSGTLTTPDVAIPAAGAGTSMLKFSVWFDTEGGNSYDNLTVTAHWVTTVGAPQSVLVWSKPQTMTMGTWSAIAAPLPPEAHGQTVHFSFFFNTGDSVANTGQGVYLDDLKVAIPCAL